MHRWILAQFHGCQGPIAAAAAALPEAAESPEPDPGRPGGRAGQLQGELANRQGPGDIVIVRTRYLTIRTLIGEVVQSQRRPY